jgi:uncharacterized lipoprotein YmbA
MKTSFPALPSVLSAALLATVLLWNSGCSLPQAQADSTRYFVLSSSSTPAAPSTPAGPHWRIALRPVQVPSFLRGKAMQVRLGGNEVSYADDYRWAETLEAGIGRVLRESLDGRGVVSRVVTSAGDPHDYDVVVHVLRCEGDGKTGVARFSAEVEIFSTGPGAPRRAHDVFSTEVRGWNRQDYAQLAQKLSEAVDQLAGRIAELLENVEQP